MSRSLGCNVNNNKNYYEYKIIIHLIKKIYIRSSQSDITLHCQEN